MGAADPRAQLGKRDTFYLPFGLRLLLVLLGGGLGWWGVYKALPDLVTDWQLHISWLVFLPLTGLIMLALLIALVCWWAALAMRLVVTPDGIEYHEPGMTIKARWSDVAGIEDMLVDTGRGGEAYRATLLLRHSTVRATAPWSMFNRLSTRQLEIPVGLFAGNARGSYLGLLIHTYTAHLRDFGRNIAEEGHPT